MSDHYQTLGVPPSATEREIKKAYFALVRQFPPETHADDFQRIREAYEALSNPEARAAYDRAREGGGEVEPFSEHGPELGAQLRAAAEAINRDQPKEAVPLLEAALAEHPDVVVVRDMLAVALMNSGDARRAAQELEELTRREPQNPLFHVRLGHCYRDLKLERPALAAYLKAREVAPEELGIRFVLSDFYASQKKWKEALEELDAADKMAARRAERDWEPLIRRVGVQLQRGKSRLIQRELQALLAALPAEEEVRKHVADRLSSLAARAFALQRPRDGNHILEVARSLKPQGHLGRFPDKVTVLLDRLPEGTQAWLREQPQREIVKPLWSRGYAGVVALLLFGLALAWAGSMLLLSSLTANAGWLPDKWVITAALVAGGAWVTSAGVLGLIRVAKSPLGKFTTLHSHYLVQADVDRVTVWPLINLVRVSTTHQHTYSVYTASSVRMKFGRRTATLNIRGKQVAEDLANAAAELRGRLLDLLNSGLLEADGEVDFIPRALLSGKDPEAWRRRLRRARVPAAVAFAGVMASLAFIPFHLQRMDDVAWDFAMAKGPPGLAQYLEERPDGRHAAEARANLERALDGALDRLRRTRAGQAPVLEELLAALRRAGTNRVRVEHAPAVKLGGFRAPAGVQLVNASLPLPEQERRQKRLTAELQRRIDRLLGPNQVVELRERLTPPSPVVLRIGTELGYSGAVYSLSSDPTLKYYGLEARSDVSLLEHRYQLRAEPDREVSWSGGAAPTPGVTYARMADAAMDALAQQLAKAMQLPE